MEKDDDEPNATEDSIERQIQQVIEKGIEDDEKEKSSQADDDDDDRKSDSKSKSNKSDSSDDEMERLRKEALSKYTAVELQSDYYVRDILVIWSEQALIKSF